MVKIEKQDDGTEVVTIHTARDLYDLRKNHEDWHEGALSILTYKSANPVGYITHEPMKGMTGMSVRVGDTIWKDPAGNFGYVS